MDAADARQAVAARLARADLRSWRRPTMVVATGKAAAEMAGALGADLRGFVLVPVGVDASGLPAGLEVLRGGHPVPTEEGIAASRRILAAVDRLGRGDRLLYLVSGGTSALFEVPRAGLGADDLTDTYRVLLASGAPIHAVNAVRRALSRVKGGGLAGRAWPAEVLTLAVSDVPGDDPATIGSGPTVFPAGRVRGGVARILERYGLRERLPAAVLKALAEPARALPRRAAGGFEIVCSNARSRRAALTSLKRAGYLAARPRSAVLEGDVVDAARSVSAAIERLLRAGGRRALVLGGETTVVLGPRAGVGGRNQQLAALVALALAGRAGFACMAGGTDGIDGASDAAGAIVDGRTAARAAAAGHPLEVAVRELDAGTALARARASVRTGPTGTNVGDLLVVATRAPG